MSIVVARRSLLVLFELRSNSSHIVYDILMSVFYLCPPPILLSSLATGPKLRSALSAQRSALPLPASASSTGEDCLVKASGMPLLLPRRRRSIPVNESRVSRRLLPFSPRSSPSSALPHRLLPSSGTHHINRHAPHQRRSQPLDKHARSLLCIGMPSGGEEGSVRMGCGGRRGGGGECGGEGRRLHTGFEDVYWESGVGEVGEWVSSAFIFDLSCSSILPSHPLQRKQREIAQLT